MISILVRPMRAILYQKPVAASIWGLLTLIIAFASLTWAKPMGEAQLTYTLVPNRQYAVHQEGQVTLTVTNMGQLGRGMSGLTTDCGGEPCPSCEYPSGSNLQYLFGGGFWLGAVVGQDTLVSTGADGWFTTQELMPDAGTVADFQVRSNDPGSPDYSPEAISLRDLICAYSDTITDPTVTGTDPIDNRPHVPLYATVSERSYAWAESPLSDFVLFEYCITNSGAAPWQDMFFGIHIDGDVYHPYYAVGGYLDDVTGYLASENMAYLMDDDGDPNTFHMTWDTASVRSAFAVKLHGSKPAWSRINYNWWTSHQIARCDFGPRLAGTPEDPFRSFGPQLGTPTGDRNKYYMLQHAEQDYDMLTMLVSHTGEGFLEPVELPATEDMYFDARFLLSVGPYDVAPGDSVVIYFSVVMGPDVHVNPGDFYDYSAPSSPQQFYDRLDFAPLIANAGQADSVYEAEFASSSGIGPEAIPTTLPDIISLSPNYPNPFNPSTVIRYNLPRRTYAEVMVYNLLGETVAMLASGIQDAGEHVVRWDGCDGYGHPAPSGIYFYQLKADGMSVAKKMVLMR